uniref:Scavenger receptor class A member 5-like n=1 Tax=Crassostrea virginica TaxID=6565 RepID=A0A8B8C9F4_CRAVI|nr:scavenger receptor class A member 5-like [Crassostrea virginica]
MWYTVCDDDFDNNDAKVVCRMLGKNTTNAVAYTNAHFGQGKGFILLNNLGCTGSEKDLFYCNFAPLGTLHCNHAEDAGVKCG